MILIAASVLAGSSQSSESAGAHTIVSDAPPRSNHWNTHRRFEPRLRPSTRSIFLADAPTPSPATTQSTSLRDDPRYRRWQTALTWGLVILITFVTAAAAIIVFSRRFRGWIGREKKSPTPDEDVWSMHKLPDEPHDSD